MSGVVERLKQLLFGWGTVGVIYSLSDNLQGPGRVMQPSWLDNLIVYQPQAIWGYLSFFLLIPLAYLYCPEARLLWLRRSMQLTALLAGVIYLLWPTTMVYPPLSTAGSTSERWLQQLILVDSPQNCLPSLHMALTLLAIWALGGRQKLALNLLCGAWGLWIAFSIIQLRRHLFIDIASGTLLALLVGLVLQLICQRQWLSANKESL